MGVCYLGGLFISVGLIPLQTGKIIITLTVILFIHSVKGNELFNTNNCNTFICLYLLIVILNFEREQLYNNVVSKGVAYVQDYKIN